jgi:hypothetical protein
LVGFGGTLLNQTGADAVCRLNVLLPVLRRSVGLGPVFFPCTARTDEQSAITREKSSRPATCVAAVLEAMAGLFPIVHHQPVGVPSHSLKNLEIRVDTDYSVLLDALNWVASQITYKKVGIRTLKPFVANQPIW